MVCDIDILGIQFILGLYTYEYYILLGGTQCSYNTNKRQRVRLVIHFTSLDDKPTVAAYRTYTQKLSSNCSASLSLPFDPYGFQSSAWLCSHSPQYVDSLISLPSLYLRMDRFLSCSYPNICIRNCVRFKYLCECAKYVSFDLLIKICGRCTESLEIPVFTSILQQHTLHGVQNVDLDFK